MGQGRDVLVGGRKRPLLRPHPSLRCRSKPKEAARCLRAGAEVRLGVPVAFKCPGGDVGELGTPFTLHLLISLSIFQVQPLPCECCTPPPS